MPNTLVKPELPEYVTPDVYARILSEIKAGALHPRHPACDFTAEVAAGVPIPLALAELMAREARGDTSSRYQPPEKYANAQCCRH